MGNEKFYLKPSVGCAIENKVYFMNMLFNALFYIDLDDDSVHYVDVFLDECGQVEQQRVWKSFLYENKLYFIPVFDNKIRIYDIEKKRIEVIILSQAVQDLSLVGAVRWLDKLYLFSQNVKNGIYVLDLKTGKVQLDEEMMSLFDSDCIIVRVVLTERGTVITAGWRSNQLFEVDLESKKMVGVRTLKDEMEIYTLRYNQGECWILFWNSTDIYEWDTKNDEIQVYKLESEEVQGDVKPLPYNSIVFLEEEFLVLGYNLKKILRIDREKKNIGNSMLLPREFLSEENKYPGLEICIDGIVLQERALIFPGRGNGMLSYDKKKKQLVYKKLEVNLSEYPQVGQVLGKFFATQGIVYEGKENENLNLFLHLLGRDYFS